MARLPKPAPVKTLTGIVNEAADLIRTERKGALQYVPELTWMLFLRACDLADAIEEAEAFAVGDDYEPTVPDRYRWRNWAEPNGPLREELNGPGSRTGDVLRFVNEEMFPALAAYRDDATAPPRRRVVGEIFHQIGGTRIARSERLLLDALNLISQVGTDGDFHISSAYETLLLKMGEQNNDGGQFFTPREVIRAMVRIVDPKPGETVFDPCAGTGGFLGLAYEHMAASADTPEKVRTLKERSFYGRESEGQAIPIGLANMMLHGIDRPYLWHGNTLTRQSDFSALWEGAPDRFDVILTNPPFGGKEPVLSQSRYAYKTSASQVLFLQEILDSLAPGGRCGLVIDEGVLFRTNEAAFVQTKRRLLEECELWGIVSLPGGVFSSAGAGVKTNLLFFDKGKPTQSVWYYDLSDIKVGKKNPLTQERMGDLFELAKTRADSERSWSVPIEEIASRKYDLKAINPNRKTEVDPRTSAEILDGILARQKEIDASLDRLRTLIGSHVP